MSNPMVEHRLVLKYIRADGCDMTAEADIVESGLVIRALVSKGIEINEADEVLNAWVDNLDDTKAFIDSLNGVDPDPDGEAW